MRREGAGVANTGKGEGGGVSRGLRGGEGESSEREDCGQGHPPPSAATGGKRGERKARGSFADYNCLILGGGKEWMPIKARYAFKHYRQGPEKNSGGDSGGGASPV